ncbi:Conserved_hypothetical protein [Hexamita inflata]|uniref:Uncharacterized protein n=1 Tax=Hexamita inflata TaxID=28002 RepID=A0AA86PVB5_9EUKA|nr:Conserved hypothetical protein [Hexamita inflata]
MSDSDLSVYDYDSSDSSDILHNIGDQIQLKSDTLIVIQNDQMILVKQQQCCLLDSNLIIQQIEQNSCTSPLKVIVYQNRYVVQAANALYYLNGCSLEQFISCESIEDIFIVENKLYVLRYERIYLFTNNRLKIDRFQPGYMHMYQFCGTSYSLESSLPQIKKQMTSLYKLGQQKQVIKEYQDLLPVFNSLNILVFKDNNHIYVFNLTNEQLVQVDEKFGDNQINNQIEVGENGVQLKRKIQEELFGTEIYEQTCQMIKEWNDKNKNQIIIIMSQKLEKCQLMHVFKPLPYVDLYIAIEDNLLHIVDKEMNILKQTPINCKLYSGYEDSTMCEDPIIFEGYFSNAILCKGKIYIQVINKVYQLKDSMLQFFIEIPDFKYNDTNSYYCAIFSVQNELYLRNMYTYYVYRDEQLQPIKEQLIWAFQSHDQVFTYEWTQDQIDDVMKVNEFLGDKEERHIIYLPKVDYASYTQNGIMIALYYDTCSQIIDLQTGNKIEIEIDQDDPLKYIELGDFGLQFQKDIVSKYLGDSVYWRQLEIYQKFITQQMEYPSYLHEIHNIIPFNLILEQYQIQYSERVGKTLNKIIALNEKIISKQTQILSKIDIQVSVQHNLALLLQQSIFGEITQ